jgi:hypothetical protein
MSRAYLALGEKLDQPGVHGEAFNIGSGKPTTTREITRLASLAYDGKEREPVFRGPIRPTPVIKSLDISKAGRLLGWKPQLSMTDALQRTIVLVPRFLERALSDFLERILGSESERCKEFRWSNRSASSRMRRSARYRLASNRL